ncbi:MAG: hypothetical protein ACD_55C00143G0001, partial [uncultured bacterium]
MTAKGTKGTTGNAGIRPLAVEANGRTVQALE